MNTLHCVAFKSLEAPDCLTLNLNTQIQREGAVCVLLDSSIRHFSNAVCGSLWHYSMMSYLLSLTENVPGIL